MGTGELPLTPELKLRARRWLAAYRGHEVVPGEGIWEATPKDVNPEEDERQWAEEGQRLRDAIQDELGPRYEVTYET